MIDTAGMEYPGEAFHLTLRRQDLGPELAVEGAEGTVALRALVSADGAVRSVEVATSSGSPVLDRAAADAVRRWRFTPATRDGVPIDAYAMLRIRYIVR
ncbi:MAG TPA: energy transducer TonB [bacterium]|nr:energy transducer TonB [bacterium]